MSERGNIFYRITDMRSQTATQERPSEVTMQCAVIKDNTYTSMSPAIHNAGYAAVGLGNFQYSELTIDFEQLPGVVARFRDPKEHFAGVSVGAPFKGEIMKTDDEGRFVYLDEIDGAVKAIGAVNTIAIEQRDGTPHLTGTNTDWLGFVGAIDEQGVSLKDKRVAILGAGGAARASIYGALQEGASSVQIFNRTVEGEKIEALKKQFGIDVLKLDTLTPKMLEEFDIIVHSTKAGTQGEAPVVPVDGIQKKHTIVEWVYSKDFPATPLELEAQAREAKVVSGRGILVHQAKGQFHRFTGKEAPVDVMREEVIKGTTA